MFFVVNLKLMQMEFTKSYNDLKLAFSLSNPRTVLAGTGLEIRVMQFTSNSSLVLPSSGAEGQTIYRQTIARVDDDIMENKSFSYPVFVPSFSEPHGKAIVLLHGLNERSWLKYLPWAYHLAANTNRPVILFPIAFHMNRSPEMWANPRAMMPLLNSRQQIKELEKSTFANVALSQRLSDDPLRFFVSGRQSAEDLIQLIETIKDGNYPLLKSNAQIDFFAYSIGAFLAQIMFIANPKSLLSASRLFLFCGGAHFSEMFGTSRLIMDSDAYARLRKYYLDDFLKELQVSTPFSLYMLGNQLGEAFVSMVSPECNKKFRQERLAGLRDRIRVVSLKKDKVIPSSYIQSTFACINNPVKGMVQELDFPYEYSHEIPFPVLNSSNAVLVDRCFTRVFEPVVDFLM